MRGGKAQGRQTAVWVSQRASQRQANSSRAGLAQRASFAWSQLWMDSPRGDAKESIGIGWDLCDPHERAGGTVAGRR